MNNAQNQLAFVLFRAGCLVGSLLLTLVIVSPITNYSPDVGCPRWLKLFACDPTLRCVTIVSALGILITSCLCFRFPETAQK